MPLLVAAGFGQGLLQEGTMEGDKESTEGSWKSKLNILKGL